MQSGEELKLTGTFSREREYFYLDTATCVSNKIGERETEKLHLLVFLDILFTCEFDWGFY